MGCTRLLSFFAFSVTVSHFLSASSVKYNPTIMKKIKQPSVKRTLLLWLMRLNDKSSTELHVVTKSSTINSNIAVNSTSIKIPLEFDALALKLPKVGEFNSLIGHSHVKLDPDIDTILQEVVFTLMPGASTSMDPHVMLVTTEGHVTSHTPIDTLSQYNSWVMLWGQATYRKLSKTISEQVTLCEILGNTVSKSMSATSSRVILNEGSVRLLLSTGEPVPADTTDKAFDFNRSFAKSLYTTESTDTKHQPPSKACDSNTAGV